MYDVRCSNTGSRRDAAKCTPRFGSGARFDREKCYEGKENSASMLGVRPRVLPGASPRSHRHATLRQRRSLRPRQVLRGQREQRDQVRPVRSRVLCVNRPRHLDCGLAAACLRCLLTQRPSDRASRPQTTFAAARRALYTTQQRARHASAAAPALIVRSATRARRGTRPTMASMGVSSTTCVARRRARRC
jgi:hypothetical protein